ncbi:MAG: DUF599 domain-containing protein [Pseudomonadota bacterium]
MSDPVRLLDLFTLVDWFAFAFLVFSLGLTRRIIEHPPTSMPSTHVLMRQYRRQWMAEMAARDVRIFDAQVLATLRQGATFFASTTLISIGGGAAILGQAERVETVARDLNPGFSAPLIVWEVKILLVVILLGLAFLKFVWSIRLFGYCAVMMSAIPNDGTSVRAKSMARRAGELNIYADRSFTRGLRTVYFALASLAWFFGPWGFILAVLITDTIIWRREFRSDTRKLLLADHADAEAAAEKA